jgi:4-alpha-glucanotransferase
MKLIFLVGAPRLVDSAQPRPNFAATKALLRWESMNADLWGVSYGYTDTDGARHEASAETRKIIRAALGAPDDPTIAPADAGAIVTSASDRWSTHSPAMIALESGDYLPVPAGWTKPKDFPLGYHRIRFEGHDHDRAFIAAPDTCALPDTLRGWGWATQLYAMRSAHSWGIGDFGDLTTLNQWSAERGATYTLINPLHAPTPIHGQQPSPYFPTSRIWRNPLFLRLEDVPGWDAASETLTALAAEGRALNDSRYIDRDNVRALKISALHDLWLRWTADPQPTEDHRAFAQWRKAEGSGIENFALYSALVQTLGGDTRTWPTELLSADAEGVRAAALELQDQVSFFAWIQWLIEEQLQKANRELPIMTDLAIGVDRAGADAWVWPDAFCRTMSVGAPPDTFNTQGQNWGLPPFDPWKLRIAEYEPFIRTVRAALRHSGSLRMDHVMGLFRLWWIPEGHHPKDGCYVYLPYRDLTAIVALESSRAGVGVVGEDLGTVEPYVSLELSNRNILSYKLIQFEPGPTDQLPIEAMVAITTHDLPTLAGLWTGTDLIDGVLAEVVPNLVGTVEVRAAFARRAGLIEPLPTETDSLIGQLLQPLPETDRQLLLDAIPRGSLDQTAAANNITRGQLEHRLRRMAETLSAARIDEVQALLSGMLHDLARSPSRLVAATLDDAVYVEERPNLPGTTDQRPNWQIALPTTLEVLLRHPGVEATATTLRNRTYKPTKTQEHSKPS